MKAPRLIHLILLACLLSAAGCTRTELPTAAAEGTPITATPRPTAAVTVTPKPAEAPAVWIAAEVPQGVRSQIGGIDKLRIAISEDQAVLQVNVLPGKTGGGEVLAATTWVYAAAAAFPTVTDRVSLQDLQNAWQTGKGRAFPGKALLMSAETRAVFSAVWGQPAAGAVAVLAEDELLAAAWKGNPGSLALLPFDQLGPRWKVLRVNGLSPLDPALDVEKYPLAVTFGVTGRADLKSALQLPPGNRDPQKFTTVVMTGTTALVRGTALRMEEEGVLYPGEAVRDILRNADLTHISNEVSFDENCPPAKPLRKEMRFCSNPAYLALLQDVGADLIELTGNHLADWGYEPLIYTLKLYREKGLPYYGGGLNETDAQKPFLYEHNGTQLAFVGCNVTGPENDLATAETPGALRCDMDWMETQVRQLKAQGYLPVVTFQHYEVEDYKPQSAQRIDSQRMAAAGAVIVSGSQAHSPQGFTFAGDSLIHYGLGNLFFDQMTDYNRRAFIDRHVFYDGRYLGTELITTLLENSARPRPMTLEERARFLKELFAASQW